MRLFLFLIGFIFLSSGAVFAMYDFCESPTDYNMLPQASDIRTEYWKDIPDYHPDNDNIKFEKMENNHPTFPIKFKFKRKYPKNTNPQK